MKILLINKFHYIRGGSESYYFSLADALQKRGHRVIFFSMKDQRNVPCSQEEYFVSNRELQGSLKSKLNLLLCLTYSREAYHKLSRLLADEKPDLVILNLLHKHLTLSVIDAIRDYDPKLPIFWVMHDLAVICPAYTMRNGYGKICEECMYGDFAPCVKNRCIKGSRLMSMLSGYEAQYIRRRKWYDVPNLYICPSEFHRRKLEESGFTQQPIVTMHNPLPIGTAMEVVPADEGYLLYFGRLSPEKGVASLIGAACRTKLRLVIVGTGAQEQELRQLAQGAANIEFKGFQTGDTLKAYVENCRGVVIPSGCYENCPYSAMEAMAMGKPLIVSQYGGLPELVDDGKNGFIYGYDTEELDACMEKLVAMDPEDYRAMCLHAVEKARQMFRMQNYIAQIEEFYQQFRS